MPRHPPPPPPEAQSLRAFKARSTDMVSELEYEKALEAWVAVKNSEALDL